MCRRTYFAFKLLTFISLLSLACALHAADAPLETNLELSPSEKFQDKSLNDWLAALDMLKPDEGSARVRLCMEELRIRGACQ